MKLPTRAIPPFDFSCEMVLSCIDYNEVDHMRKKISSKRLLILNRTMDV